MTTKRKPDKVRFIPPPPGSRDKARFIPLDKACEYGGFSRGQGYRLIKAGKFTAKKLGTRTLIDKASLDRFLDALPRLAS